MKRILTVIITGFILCSVVYSSSDTVSTKFLPLKIGNVWTYVRTGGWPPNRPPVYYKSIVERDTIISGHKYYYITRCEHLRPYSPTTNWFFLDSLNGNLKCFENSLCNQLKYEILDSLSSITRDSFKVCPNNMHSDRMLYLHAASVWWGVQSNDKYFDRFWNLSHEVRQYSKYFGLTFSKFGENGHEPLFYNLRGCVIDGVLYGDTNTFVGINQISSEIPVNFGLQQKLSQSLQSNNKFRI